ncbi:unnamed protein product [Ectocarpus sp. CCAP 1310/34]|nr:unnamed protein product [Ectocarpus sp. CCAP 1310/34]
MLMLEAFFAINVGFVVSTLEDYTRSTSDQSTPMIWGWSVDAS